MQKQDDDYKNYATEVLSLIKTENKAISKDGWRIRVTINLQLFEDWSWYTRTDRQDTDEDYDEGIEKYSRFCDRINLDWAHYIMGVKLLMLDGECCISDVEIDYST